MARCCERHSAQRHCLHRPLALLGLRAPMQMSHAPHSAIGQPLVSAREQLRPHSRPLQHITTTIGALCPASQHHWRQQSLLDHPPQLQQLLLMTQSSRSRRGCWQRPCQSGPCVSECSNPPENDLSQHASLTRAVCVPNPPLRLCQLPCLEGVAQRSLASVCSCAH